MIFSAIFFFKPFYHKVTNEGKDSFKFCLLSNLYLPQLSFSYCKTINQLTFVHIWNIHDLFAGIRKNSRIYWFWASFWFLVINNNIFSCILQKVWLSATFRFIKWISFYLKINWRKLVSAIWLVIKWLIDWLLFIFGNIYDLWPETSSMKNYFLFYLAENGLAWSDLRCRILWYNECPWKGFYFS